jgi:hypothetical protein
LDQTQDKEIENFETGKEKFGNKGRKSFSYLYKNNYNPQYKILSENILKKRKGAHTETSESHVVIKAGGLWPPSHFPFVEAQMGSLPTPPTPLLDHPLGSYDPPTPIPQSHKK